MPRIRKSRILVMATHGFEQSELVFPMEKLKEYGAEVTVASPDGERIRGWDGDDWGHYVDADARIGDLGARDFDALVLPGGQINPDILRTNPEAIRLLKDFDGSGKPVAAICHGPWMLIEADMLRGREATSYPSIATDMKNAGARWRDAEVVVDQGIITSRSPDDLDAFVSKIVEAVEAGRHDREATGARIHDEETGQMTRGPAPNPQGEHYDDSDNRDSTSLPGPGGAASGQGREGGRLARDVGSRDELKRATERPAGATRVVGSDKEEEETR